MLFYDITDILEFARENATLSGIQRFSLEILTELVSRQGPERLRLIAFHPTKKKVVTFESSYFNKHFRYNQSDFCSAFNIPIGGSRELENYLEQKYGKKSVRREYHRVRMLLSNNLSKGRSFRRRNIVLNRKNQYNLMDPRFEKGDIVFIPGATWNFDDYIALLAEARAQRGIRIYPFIHDLIPLTSPEHVADHVPEQFDRWLRKLTSSTDKFITNSLATKLDLANWMVQNKIKIPSCVVPLAHQFCGYERRGEASPDERISARVRNAARLPYVLCVGTIEI